MPGTDFLSELEKLKNERLRAMEIAAAQRAGDEARIGTACFPGC